MTDGRVKSRALRRILAADAAWDLLLGAVLCITPWVAEPLLGLALQSWWPLCVILGAGTAAFGIELARAARGVRSIETCTIAAIANGLSAGALIVVVGLVPALDTRTNSVLLLIALVCGGFAFLEWKQVRS